MAVNIVASMAEFNLGEDYWVEYSERFEMYLMANGVTDGDIWQAVFLSTIGGPAYKLLRSLVGEEVKTQSLDDLSKAMKAQSCVGCRSIADSRMRSTHI